MTTSFWEQQERARVASGRLLAIFVAASIAVVLLMYSGFAVVLAWIRMLDSSGAWLNAPWWRLMWSGELFAWTAGGVLSVVLYHWWRWVKIHASGGSSIALSLGGRHVAARDSSPEAQRLYNVVSEMALAAGIPAPQVFVLEREPAINAFAAGYSIDEAAICATRGAITMLSRDELQAVIAHEFSHILNGDMATNVRLAGILYGFTSLGAMGSELLRMTTREVESSHGTQQNLAFPPFVVLGLVLVAVGGAGMLVGQVVKAAFGRQREFLADALAVQFTRNGTAMASALRKIGGYELGSGIRAAGAESVSHLMFSNIHRETFGGLLATHPPLAMRIRRLDASFIGTFPRVAAPEPLRELGRVDPRYQPTRVDVEPMSPLAAETSLTAAVAASSEASPSGASSELPVALREALDSPVGALAAIYALLAARGASADESLRAIESVTHPRILAEARRLVPAARQLRAGGAVALARLSAPQLRAFTAKQADQARGELRAIAESDSTLQLSEFLLMEVVSHWLDPSRQGQPAQRFAAVAPVRGDIGVVLAAVADVAGDGDARDRAAAAGRAALPAMQREHVPALARGAVTLGELRTSVERLRHASLHLRRMVVQASAAAAVADGSVNGTEADLVGFLADLLGVAQPALGGVQPGPAEAP